MWSSWFYVLSIGEDAGKQCVAMTLNALQEDTEKTYIAASSPA